MDRKFLFLVLIFFLVSSFFVGTIVFNSRARQIRATNPPEASTAKSFLLGFPNEIAAGGSVKINAVVRAEDESAIPGAEVCLTPSLGTATPSCAKTNEAGISEFTLTSPSAGTSQVNALINNRVPVGTALSIQFNP